jgi:hypothetical protein
MTKHISDSEVLPIGVFLANHNGDTGMRYWDFPRWKIELDSLKKMGANTIWFIPFQFGQREPEDFNSDSAHWTLQKKICQEVIDLGLKVGIYSSINDIFEKTIEENPDWKAENGVLFLEEGCACPSVPQAWDEILRLRDRVFSELPRIDYLMTPATDNGGCCCTKCEDWPTVYLESYRKEVELCRKYHPNLKAVAASHALSLAHSQKVREIIKSSDWVDYVADIPRGTGKPIIKYYMNPEITMLGGWGKWGPCPILRGIEKSIRTDTDGVAGYIQYCEGIHDDVNRFAVIRMASDKQATAISVANEYAKDWLGLVGQDVESMAELILELGGGVWADRTTYVDPEYFIPNSGIDDRVKLMIDLRKRNPHLNDNYRYWLLHYRALSEAMNVISDEISVDDLSFELLLCRKTFEKLEPAYALWLSKISPYLLPDQAPWIWPRSFHFAWKAELAAQSNFGI